MPFPARQWLLAAAALCAASACAPPTPPAPAAGPAPAPPDHAVIPVPASVRLGPDSFAITGSTRIVVDPGSAEAERIADQLAALLRPPTGFPLPVETTGAAAAAGALALRLAADRAELGDEGYELRIQRDGATLTARRPAGLFRGVQTLRQLLPPRVEAENSVLAPGPWKLPTGEIVDRPRFAWRGAMLDVARHFFTVEEVKQYLDLLALYKLNVLHLHLSDDQGWRIQIDSWPRLTEVGGSTEVGGGPGGHYTKADYAAIVRYAQDRYITVVPEIDMPGHTNAALAAYPEFSCGTRPPALYTGIEVGFSALCVDRDTTYRFVEDVIRELAEMTPGPFLHVGGDEVEALGHEEYAGFIERVQEIVHRHGKRMVGWEEIAKARLHPSTLVQQWKSDSATAAVAQGARLILSPASRAYLDMKYHQGTELGLQWAGLVEVRDAYEWDPARYLDGVSEDDVVGVEAPLWSETLRNLTAAQFMAVPRLPAVAEVAWSQAEDTGWEGFRERLALHAPRWRLLGINYYASPLVRWRE